MIIFTPNTVIKSADINLNFTELKTKTDYLITPDNNWHYIGASGEPAFQNSWVNYEASETNFYQASFFKDALGNVRCRGIVKSGTVSYTVPIFTLPAGYRPKQQIRFPQATNPGAVGYTNVWADGRVTVEVGSNGWIFLDSINFKAEQ